MTALKITVIAAAIFTLGVAVGRFSLPQKVITKTETKIVEKVVLEKEKKADKEIIVTERRRSDGTVTKRTEIKDKSVTTTKETADTTVNSLTHTVTEYRQDLYKLRALSALHSGEIVYGAGVERRLLGPFWLGAWALTDKTLGLSLGLTF